ncbi:2Fe-2S iron-sulfur cluster-binding protein [Streptomyces sp. M19]
MRHGAGGRAVLDAVLRARPETPYSCRDGLCGTCRAKVVRGSVEMDRQYALGREELDRGYTLACRARAVSAEVALDFDA